MLTLQPLLAIIWRPIVPPLQIYAAVFLLLVLAAVSCARTQHARILPRAAFFLLRAAFILGIGVFLMGPSKVPPQQSVEVRPNLSVLVDTSQSMQTEDCDAQSRLGYVQNEWLPEQTLERLSQQFQLELLRFDTDIRSLPASALRRDADDLATGEETRIFYSLSNALLRFPDDNQDGSMVLLISDGQDTQETPFAPAAAIAKSRHVPVYTVAMGRATVQHDLTLLAIPMQDYLLPGEPGSILVKVYQAGQHSGSTTLRTQQGTEVKTIPVELKPQSVWETEIPIRQEESGHYEVQLSLEPLPNEDETKNNNQTVYYEVQKERMKVLILEGQPFWDSKFLAQSIRKDERIEVTQITQLSADKQETIVTRSEQESPRLPRSVEEWAEYDVVILGQGMEQLFQPGTAEQLVQFVTNGGGHLIFARGLAYDPASPEGRQLAKGLAPLEPVVWGDQDLTDTTLSLTPSGRVSQWFSTAKMGLSVEDAFQRLPGFQYMRSIQRAKPAAVVLAQAQPAAGAPAAEGQPALVTMSAGSGTVVAVLGDGLWQWSLLAPENQDLAPFYDAFWSNLIRWLTLGGNFQPGEQISLQLSHSTLRLEDPLTIDVIYKHTPPAGAHPQLHVTADDGISREIALVQQSGRDPRFRATFSPRETGVHRVHLKAPGMLPDEKSARFNVYDLNLELLQTSANPMPLRILAEHSGGQFYEWNEHDKLLRHLERRRAAALVAPQPEYIWNQAPWMFIILCWIGMEWILRRQAGLP